MLMLQTCFCISVQLETLHATVRSQRPSFRQAAFPTADVAAVYEEVAELHLKDLALVKAFDPRNQCNQIAASFPLAQWVCQREACGNIFTPSTTVREAVSLAGGPISARVASKRDARPAAPWLRSFLSSLEFAMGRPYDTGDVYITASPSASASLGWHIDDIDVLLIMLRGAKRFRVAGQTVGSEAVIDTVLKPGDAIFIPALTFHTGGDDVPEDSLMLSVALAWADEACGREASDVVAQWRQARQAVLLRAPELSGSWEWGRTAEGIHRLQRALSASSAMHLLRRFLDQRLLDQRL